MGDRGGFEGGFGARRGERGRGDGDRGRGRGRGRGRRRGRRDDDKEGWTPVTKLGRLVMQEKITTLEEIYLYSLPIKEYQIIDKFCGDSLADEVMCIKPVQKQTSAGQRTRFKAFVLVGDKNGHIGLGHKCSKEVAGAIKGAIIAAKLALVPIRRGYWGSRLGKPHTVPCKLTGKCGSVRVRLIPAPRGSGLVAAPCTKKVLSFAGITDCYTSTRGSSRTMGNFVKAVFYCLKKSYGYLTPDMWGPTTFGIDPFAQFSKDLAEGAKLKK